MPVSYDFTGRTALISGGAGDIGGAVARRIMAGGGRVATLDLRPADLGTQVIIAPSLGEGSGYGLVDVSGEAPWASVR